MTLSGLITVIVWLIYLWVGLCLCGRLSGFRKFGLLFISLLIHIESCVTNSYYLLSSYRPESEKKAVRDRDAKLKKLEFHQE